MVSLHRDIGCRGGGSLCPPTCMLRVPTTPKAVDCETELTARRLAKLWDFRTIFHPVAGGKRVSIVLVRKSGRGLLFLVSYLYNI